MIFIIINNYKKENARKETYVRCQIYEIEQKMLNREIPINGLTGINFPDKNYFLSSDSLDIIIFNTACSECKEELSEINTEVKSKSHLMNDKIVGISSEQIERLKSFI